MTASDSRATGPFTALIGDVVASRRFRGGARAKLQRQLEALLGHLNHDYPDAIRADFVLTEGDSFQALLGQAETLPDMIWDLETTLPNVNIRLAVGFGSIDTELKKQAIGMDGPAFHNARSAMHLAEKEGLLGGVFLGFGQFEDLVLNGFARLLQRLRSELTEPQRTIANLLRKDPSRTQTSVAEELGITRQAVSGHVKAMGWEDFMAGETAWRAALRRFAARSRQPDVSA